jgi:hypothetical protein
MARGARKGRPVGRRLKYQPKRKPARELLAFVERCRGEGWTVLRVAREALGTSERSLARWLAERGGIPLLVQRTARVATVTPAGLRLDLTKGGKL